MPYQIEETGALARRAKVEVPVERFERSYNGALRKLSKRVRLSGFRKGNIPMSVMKRNYGPSVMQDVVEELLREQIDVIVSDAERVIFLAQPKVSQLPTESTPLKFEVDFELRPKLDPVGYMGLDVERPVTEATEADVEERLQALRDQHGVLEPVEGREVIEAGDTVTLDFKAVGDDDPALEEMQGEDVSIVVGSGQALAGIEQALEGAAFGSTQHAKVTLDESFPVESLKGKEVDLEIVIKDVKRKALPELDDEFAADTGMGETLEAVRAALKEQLEHERAHQARHVAEDKLVDALIAKTPFELPPQFVEEQIDRAMASEFKRMTGQDIAPQFLRGEALQGMRDELSAQVSKQIKSEFLLMAIAEKEKLKVDDNDLRAYFAHQSQHMQVDPKTFERYMRGDQQRLQQAAASALLEKTLTLLLKEAKIVEIPWSSVEQQGDSEDQVAAGEEE